MHATEKRAFFKIPLVILLAALLSGCAGPLRVEYRPAPTENQTPGTQPHRAVLVRPFRDARAAQARGADPRVVGKIDATTQDIYGSRLVLEEPPARLVSDSFRRYLAGAGYRVVDEDQGGTGFAGLELDGEVRRFVLDVGPRDRIDISLYIEVREGGSGDVVWSGVVEKKDSRYAGVFGTSRSSLSDYISRTLTDVFRTTVDKAGPILAGKTGAAQGEEGLTEGRRRTMEEPTEGGGLIIKTTPGRAKVFLDGVYYGFSPLVLRLRPGIYELKLKKEGFFVLTEKVAVDSGRETEVEERLRRKGE